MLTRRQTEVLRRRVIGLIHEGNMQKLHDFLCHGGYPPACSRMECDLHADPDRLAIYKAAAAEMD